jgi:hypothetical protein
MKKHIRLFAVYGLIPFALASLLFFWVTSLPTSGKPYEYEETSNQESTPTQETTAEEVQTNNTQPTYEADPIITCNNEKCGNREVRQSVCNTSTCCQVGDKWQWTESQSLCYQMQQDYSAELEELKQKEYEFAKSEQEQLFNEFDKQNEKRIADCKSEEFNEWNECNNDCNSRTDWTEYNTYEMCTNSCKMWYDTGIKSCI